MKKEKLQAFNEKLFNSNRELEKTMNELKDAQKQLILSEKMAALGQIVAGVAHEVNSPLAVIVSASTNLNPVMKRLLAEMPVLLSELSSKERYEFYELLGVVNREQKEISSQQTRGLKKKIKETLKEKTGDLSYELSNLIVDSGLYDVYENYLDLIEGKKGLICLQAIFDIGLIKKTLTVVLKAAEKAAKTILALKTYFHQSYQEEKQNCSVIEGIETILTLLTNQTKNNVQITLEYDEIPMIQAYPDKLGQVWLNVIGNALHAMNYKGSLHIGVRKQNGFIKVSITDNGHGIPQNIQSRIFEPFFTTKKAGEGSGLGLEICRKIVEEHGGKIDFESMPGLTTFNIYLRMEQKKA